MPSGHWLILNEAWMSIKKEWRDITQCSLYLLGKALWRQWMCHTALKATSEHDGKWTCMMYLKCLVRHSTCSSRSSLSKAHLSWTLDSCYVTFHAHLHFYCKNNVSACRLSTLPCYCVIHKILLYFSRSDTALELSLDSQHLEQGNGTKQHWKSKYKSNCLQSQTNIPWVLVSPNLTAPLIFS